MKQTLILLTVLLNAVSAFTTEYYVDASRPNDTGAATGWATAKKTIQAAVNLTVNGDTVWVTNGVYDAGGKVTPGYSLTNRVCITNTITVKSVNGAAVTIIKGRAGGSWRYDVDSIRGVFMTNGSHLIGFSVTNGYTLGFPGDPTFEQSGAGIWLATNCVVSDCILAGNDAYSFGGGVFLFKGGTLDNCTLIANKSGNGCWGGGACLWNGGVLNDCLLEGNSAANGGGAYLRDGGVLNRCIFKDNWASSFGGGVYAYNGGIVNNSLFLRNSSYSYGGGAFVQSGSSLNNCTVFESSNKYGGGVMLSAGGILNNCIVWNNSAPAISEVTGTSFVNDTCAPDGVTHGQNGCITNAPLFEDAANENFQLRYNSPCIDSGNNSSVLTSKDLAGDLRVINETVDMGAYEFRPDILEITPMNGFDSFGYEGGMFSPSNQIYTLKNTSSSNLVWSTSWSSSWIAVSPASGTLLAGRTTNVTVKLTSTAVSLPVGTNEDAVVFKNLTGNTTQLRPVTLIVKLRILDHFAWKFIEPIQYIGKALPVTITAMDATTNRLVGFTNAVDVAGYVSLGTTTGAMLNGAVHDSSPTVDSARGLRFSVTDNLTVTHIRHYWGTKISLWTDDGVLLLSTNVTSVPGSWSETVLNEPLFLTAGRIYRISAYEEGFAVSYSLTSVTPHSFSNGTIISSCWASGDSFPSREYSTAIHLVDFRYSTENREIIPVTPAKTGAFVDGVWVGTVTISTAATNMNLQAEGGSWLLVGDSNSFSVLTEGGDDDGDGLTNAEERRLGTNPLLADTDGDGALDGFEIWRGTDPLDPKSKPVIAMPWLNLLLDE